MESAIEVLLNHCSWLKIGQVETLARRNLDDVTSDGRLFALTDCPCPGVVKGGPAVYHRRIPTFL